MQTGTVKPRLCSIRWTLRFFYSADLYTKDEYDWASGNAMDMLHLDSGNAGNAARHSGDPGA